RHDRAADPAVVPGRVVSRRTLRTLTARASSKVALVAVALGAAALLSACLPPAPPPPPPTTTTTTQPPPPADTQGFHACPAPSLTTMTKWKSASPYVNVGVYIGGANRGCAQPNLTASWVSSVKGQGWNLLPIWVGPQASCTTLSGATTLSSDGYTAFL